MRESIMAVLITKSGISWEAYLGTCQTSVIKLFVKVAINSLNAKVAIK